MDFQLKYTLLETLPTSQNHDVFKAKRNSDGKIFMIKKVYYSKMQQKEKQQIVQEVNLLQQINSTTIVNYCDHSVQNHKNTLYIVMDYEPIDLTQVMSKYQEDGRLFSEQKIWKLFKDVVLALKDIHKNKKGVILHRNIQPKSIFINSTSIKLGNFKFVKKLQTEQQFATTILSETYYMSPQQLQDGVFTAKTDIWALGCLLYEVCTFNKPFPGNNIFQIGTKIKEGKLKSLPTIYKKQLNRVIRWCLAKEPKDRPSVQDLLGVPMINLLIRQNRLSDVGKKISQKRKEKCSLQEEIIRLQTKLQELKRQNLKNSTEVMPLQRSKSDQNGDKEILYETNFKKFQELSLKRGISDKLSDKTSYLRNTCSSITQLTNYTSCQRTNVSKIKDKVKINEQNAYRQLNF